MGTSKAMEMGEIEGAMSSSVNCSLRSDDGCGIADLFTYLFKGEKEGFMAFYNLYWEVRGAGKHNTSMSVWCGRQGNIRRKIIW